MAGNDKYDTSLKPLCSDIEITIRIKECPKDKKSIISKVAYNPQMFKLNDHFYTFDNIKWGNESQDRVYKAAVYPFVEKALSAGQNATILAYGPTGSGKSYIMGSQGSTMNSGQNYSGLIQQSLKHIFKEDDIQVSASFVEIYDGEIHDLLNRAATVHTGSAFNLRIEKIKSLKQGLQLVNKALQIRQKDEASTSSSQNDISNSQSHTLLTFQLKINKGPKFRTSKLNLVDLAGSRFRAQRGGSPRSNLDESLSALESVITETWRKSDQILFQEDSTLVSILKDLLDPKYLVSLIACVSSDPGSDYKATVKTLEVAESIKKVQIQRRMECASALSVDQLKSKTKKIPVILSPKTENMDIIDGQDQEPGIKRAIVGKIKDCMVVLKRSDIDFNENEEGLHYTEDISPLNLSMVDIPDRKIPLTNYEAGCSVETESTLSISNLRTQNTDQDIFIRTTLCAAQYSQHPAWLDDSFSLSSSEDMAEVSPVKLHTDNVDKPDNECDCFFRGFVSANELAPVSQSSNHSILEEKQSVLVNDVSQMSISGEEITVDPEKQDEHQGFSRSGEDRDVEWLLKKPAEVFHPATRVNKMKRMKAILTTDFSEPGPSQIDYQTPRKMIKLDIRDPKLILKQVSDLLNPAAPEDIYLDDNDCDNNENQEKELNDKQRIHNNNILRILNTSTAAQLVDLPRIGFKTAVSIYQYRLIHGNFESLESLKNMPFWTAFMHRRFFEANNIIL